MNCQFRIISSTPGRARIRLSPLFKYERYAEYIKSEIDKMDGIISSSISNRTGSALVLYTPELLGENEILDRIRNIVSSELPAILEGRKYPEVHQENLFLNERHMLRSLRHIGIAIGGVIYMYTRSLSRLAAILILSNPFFLAAAPLSAYHTAARLMGRKGISIRDISDMRALQDIEAVFVNASVLFYNDETVIKNIDRLELKRQIYMEAAPDPVNIKIRSLVFSLREIGITDITLMNSNHNGLVGYAAEDLGIKEACLPDKDKSCFKPDDRDMIILAGPGEMSKLCARGGGFIIRISEHKRIKVFNANMSLRYQDIDKIPAVIELSRYSRELIIRSQNMGIAFNVIGVFLTAAGYLNPLTAIFLSIANGAVQSKYITKKIRQFEKEHFNDQKQRKD
jgi:hypothetical protein